MKRLTTAVICIASALATTAFAQQTQPGQQPAGTQRESSLSTYSATGRGGAQLRASKAIGAEVKSQTGEDIGKIEDLLFNPQTGRIDFAVLNHENKLIPVPTKLLTCSSGDHTTATGMERVSITAQIDKEKLQSAPTISDRSRWSELQQGTFSQRIYAHYGVQAPTEGVGAPGSDTETLPGRDRSSPPGTRPPGAPGAPGTVPRTPGTTPN